MKPSLKNLVSALCQALQVNRVSTNESTLRGGGGNFIFPANLDSLFLAKLYQYHALSQRTLRNLSFTNINIIEKVLIIYIK